MKNARYYLLAIALMLAGCGTFEFTFESISPQDAQTPQVLQPDHSISSTQAGTQAAPGDRTTPETVRTTTYPDVLPVPLYFINAIDSQIWRIEADGLTLTQITSEEAPITEFDSSPKDGALVYISGNNLIYYSPALGGVRKVLQPSDPDYDPGDYISLLTKTIRNPQWSPDGDWILYTMGEPTLYMDPSLPRKEGVREVFPVISSDPLPDPLPAEGDTFEGPQTMYSSVNWSPDGKYILINGSYYFALGRFKALLNVEDKSLLELPFFNGAPCCTLAWGQDGQHLYLAGNAPGLYTTGLRRANPFTAESLELVPGEAFGEYHLFAYPFEHDSGRVYGFYNSEPANPGTMPFPPLPLRMVYAANDGSGELSDLRTDHYVIGEAAWAPDGSGAVITDIAGVKWESPPPDGILRWLPANGSPAVELPAVGKAPHWGKQWED